MNSRNWVPIVSYFFGNGWLFVNVKPGSGPVVRSRRQRTRRVKSVFAYEKTNAEKYVLVPDRATTVTFENLCSVAARSTTLSPEVIQLVTNALAYAMKTFIQEGHPVQIEGIGTFTPSFSAKSQLVEEEALKRMNFVFDNLRTRTLYYIANDSMRH